MARKKSTPIVFTPRSKNPLEVLFQSITLRDEDIEDKDSIVSDIVDSVEDYIHKMVEQSIKKMKALVPKTPFAIKGKGSDFNSIDKSRYGEEYIHSGYDITYPNELMKSVNATAFGDWPQMANYIAKPLSTYHISSNDILHILLSREGQKAILDKFNETVNSAHPGNLDDYEMTEACKEFIAQNVDDSGDSGGYQIRWYIKILYSSTVDITTSHEKPFVMTFEFHYMTEVRGEWEGSSMYKHSYGW